LQLCSEDESWKRLDDLRRLYEPYVATLGRHLRMDLAPWTRPVVDPIFWTRKQAFLR
jgi:hypothetical protein